MKRLTIRVRLTVLYGGLFFVAGAILLGVTYLLVQQSITGSGKAGIALSAAKVGTFTNKPTAATTVELSDGRQLPVDEAARVLRDQQSKAQQATLNSLLTQGGIALGGVGVIAAGFGWLMAERALRPVHDITATARRVAAAASARNGLHERIGLTGPRDEIKELADTFDDMLERLDRSFDGQRRFVANASHELRTPLAINRALVEVAVTRPGTAPEVRQLGETLLAVNARHERLIDGLLTLAESERPVTEQTPVDLSDVAEHVLDQTPLGDLRLAGRHLAAGPVVGDPVLLERLAQNLVENAVRHNAPGGWLSVSTGYDRDSATLSVSNTGPVVAPYEVETIFEPFRRLAGDRTRSERGNGLGLSIVRAVARAHGGDVTAVPRPGGGLTVTVRLPSRIGFSVAAADRGLRLARSLPTGDHGQAAEPPT
jgi:signal transduction histidine kinase